MGINYNIETEMCSLRKMCLVSVTQNIIEIARHDPSTINILESIASKAAEMVPELDIPQTLNTEIVAIIRPVTKELLRWYKSYGDVARAILTPHGTVDMTKSAKAIIASHLPACQRFVTACEHCLEDDIFTLGKQVTSVMVHELCSRLANFWYDDVYGGNFDVKIMNGSLTQEQVVEGWFVTRHFEHRNISAMRYFQEKATPKSIQAFLIEADGLRSCKSAKLYITPTLCNTCLHDNVLDGEWLEESKSTISACLLLLLIKWPYQHLFLKSAELLMPNLSEFDFWDIAETISKKLSADYKDYDYKGLFLRFWNLGLMRFKSKLLDDSKDFIESLLENLSLVKDEFLVSLVFDQISQMDEDYLNHYFNYNLSYVCYKLFYYEAYESVEGLMRLLRKKYREVFLKFQNAFDRELIEDVTDGMVEDYSFLDRYEQYMSKYWVLPELKLLGKNDLV